MLVISYLDYLVARSRRSKGADYRAYYQPLVLERVLNMPWGWDLWLFSSVPVFTLALVSALIGFWLLALLTFGGMVLLGFTVFTDWPQLQGRTAQALQRKSNSHQSAVRAWLYGIHGEHVGSWIPVTGSELTIGRGGRNALVLQDPRVSRQHARVIYSTLAAT